MDDIYHRRLHLLRQTLTKKGIDTALISKKEHLFYYLGLAHLLPTEREAFLIVTATKVLLYHSPFLIPPVMAGLQSITMSNRQPFAKVLLSACPDHAVLGIEKQNLTVHEYDRCQEILTQSKFVEIDAIIQNQRLVKLPEEISAINKACKIAAKVLNWAQNFTHQPAATGITETALQHQIDEQLYTYHATPAFPTIVAFDNHTASPHHLANHARLKPSSIVLVDMGACVKGYMSDMTRTWSVATHPSPKFLLIESIVLAAYQAALKQSAEPSRTGKSIDQAARQVITQAGYGAHFIHTTGHGVGLEAHELPHISAQSTDPIPSRTVITIEPGIYVPGKFGYRFENTLVI